MQSWIHLGGGIYAADLAEEGFLRLEGQTFQGPVLELSDGVYGGCALRFGGTNGMHTVDGGMTEGWLSFSDPEFPELNLTAVLRTAKGQARLRYVLDGETEEKLAAGDTVTLASLLLPEAPELYAPADGNWNTVKAEGLLPVNCLAVKTAEGALLLGGCDFFAASEDEDGFCLAMAIRLDEELSLGEGGQTDWLYLTAAPTVDEAIAAADWLE